MEQSVKAWRTCDLKAAAALMYSGFRIVGHGKEEGRVFFEFDDTVERKSTLLSFWNKELRFEPIGFLDCLSRARDMVTTAMRA